jgi:hypothetical protein
MSYLAMSAATIENDTQPNNESILNKKRQTHVKTQKFRQPNLDFNPQKVNSVLESIHNMTDDDTELANYNSKGLPSTAKHSENFKPLNPFDFPDKPMSMGAERRKLEGMTSSMNMNDVPQPVDNDDLKLQELQSNFMNDGQVKEYYKKLFSNNPNMNNNSNSNTNLGNNKNYYSNSGNSMVTDNNQILIEKLNYMINLLEEQQDQKTGSATEEVVLYSFLGVFIIFVVDSFTRVGKYVR